MSKTIFTFLFLTAIVIPVRAAPNFEDDIHPIFKQHCLSCHNPDKKKADLDLTTVQSIEVGSSGGEIVKAGVPDTSLLYMVVNHHEDVEPMPPKKPRIAEEQIKKIHEWIAGGLIESSGGKSQLRDLSFSLAEGSAMRPENPAVPRDLPEVKMPDWKRTPPVIAMAASPWADVVAKSANGKILLYGPGTAAGELVHLGTLDFPEGNVYDLRFSQNGDLLVAGGGVGAYSGQVAIYDVKTGKLQATIADEQDVVLSADISADHRYVAIGTPSKLVKIFSAKDGKLVHRIEKHTDWVTAVRFSPDGKLLASGDRNGGIHVWETATGGIVYTLDEHKVKVTALSWRGDGQLLASAAEDGKFVLWDMKDGWSTRTASVHAGKSENRYTKRTGILDITFARDGRFITIGRDRTMKLWKADGSALKEAKDLPALPLRASIAPDGTLAYLGDLEGTIQVWDLEKMARLK